MEIEVDTWPSDSESVLNSLEGAARSEATGKGGQLIAKRTLDSELRASPFNNRVPPPVHTNPEVIWEDMHKRMVGVVTLKNFLRLV